MKVALKEGFIIGPQLRCVWPCQVVAQQHLGGTPLRRRRRRREIGEKKGSEWRKGKGREEGREPEPPFEREAKKKRPVNRIKLAVAVKSLAAPRSAMLGRGSGGKPRVDPLR